MGSTGPSRPAGATASTVSPPSRWSEFLRWSELKMKWSEMNREVIGGYLVERRPGCAKMTYRQLTAQWLKRIWNWFVKNQRWLWDFCRLILGLFQIFHWDDTSIRNTKKYSTGMKICKYGSTTNMQCQLLVIILNMMKAVKILIRFNRYSLSFLCQKQQSTTYHFFELV